MEFVQKMCSSICSCNEHKKIYSEETEESSTTSKPDIKPDVKKSKSYARYGNSLYPQKINTVIDVNGKRVVKAKSFFYLGYPFIDTDEESA